MEYTTTGEPNIQKLFLRILIYLFLTVTSWHHHFTIEILPNVNVKFQTLTFILREFFTPLKNILYTRIYVLECKVKICNGTCTEFITILYTMHDAFRGTSTHLHMFICTQISKTKSMLLPHRNTCLCSFLLSMRAHSCDGSIFSFITYMYVLNW